MIYRPTDSDLSMWDTWLLRHDGQYHLFHLQRQFPAKCDEVGRAVSTDLIHWKTLPTIHLRGGEGEWDAQLHSGLLTGYTTPVREGFAMTYGAVHAGRQMVGVVFSRDLIHWQKHPKNPVLCAAGPWYEHDPNATAMFWTAWRDPFVEAVGDGYGALLCARSSHGDHGARACVARAFTRDFIEWQLRPPLVEPGRYNAMECPERFELNGRWYLTFSTGSEWGRPLSTPSRTEAHGAFYMIADRRDGPYRVPKDDLLIGSQLIGPTLHAHTEYAARSIIGPDGQRLLYGMNVGHRTAFSAPKVIQSDAEGNLSLRFWEPLRCLEVGEPRQVFSSLQPVRMGHIVIGNWQIEPTRVVAESGPDQAIATFLEPWTDFHWTCEATLRSGDSFALLVRVNDDLAGSAVVFDFRHNTITLAAVSRGNQFGILFTPYDVIHRPLTLDTTYALRVLARDEFVEVYLDDVLLFTATQFKHTRQGRLGVAVLGQAEFTHHRVVALEPLP